MIDTSGVLLCKFVWSKDDGNFVGNLRLPTTVNSLTEISQNLDGSEDGIDIAVTQLTDVLCKAGEHCRTKIDRSSCRRNLFGKNWFDTECREKRSIVKSFYGVLGLTDKKPTLRHTEGLGQFLNPCVE
jgi:hypothetical protein